MKLRAKFNLIFAVWIPVLLAGLGFALVILRDLALGPELTRNTFFSFTMIVSAVLLMLFALGVLLLTDILRPLGLLMHAVQEVADGKTDVDIPISTTDEFGILAKNFKRMAATIQTRQQELEIEKARLETEVFRRTADLCDINESLRSEQDELLRMTQMKDSLESRLRQSQKMSTIGTLAGGIAHDFNSILTSIVSYADMAIYETPQDSPTYPMLENLMRGTMRAQHLVKQILLFSRQMKPEKKYFECRMVLEEAVTLLKASTRKEIRLHQKIEAESTRIHGDPTQIFQVIMNLGTNAAKAMKDCEQGDVYFSIDTVELKDEDVKVYEKMKPGMYVRIRVQDQGIGMDADTVERIFDPFFTTADVGGGTGLGLSVVHGIVQDHGGDISVVSHLGQGATFTVLLPAAAAESGVKQSPPEMLTEKKHILLVDDEADLAFLIKKMLERFGYDITVRISPLEAMEVFNSRPDRFDLVITDFKMPLMTGVQLACELRNLSKDIPILLMTGFSEILDQKILEEADISSVIRKPVVAADLNETIQGVLNIQRQSNSNSTQGES